MLRISEVSRRTGVSPAALRGWETRYRLVFPKRSPAGYRLYSEDDVHVIAAMRALVARGVAPAEAARLAREAGDEAAPVGRRELLIEQARSQLREALDRWDGESGARIVDRMLVTHGLAAGLGDGLLPYLRELGDSWARGETSVAHEHFAAGIVRTRLVAAAVGWEHAPGPLALLACAPDELHDIGLVGFGLALHHLGRWRIAYLGADTPAHELARAAGALSPAAVVVSAVEPGRFEESRDELSEVADEAPFFIGGAGATRPLARRLRAELLPADAVNAAEALAGRHPAAV